MKLTISNLIKEKKYPNHQDIKDRLNSFNTWGQITAQEYNELMAEAQNVYDPTPLTPLEPPVDLTPETLPYLPDSGTEENPEEQPTVK